MEGFKPPKPSPDVDPEKSPQEEKEVIEFQSRDEGIVVIHADGSERLVQHGSEEEDEVTYQMMGGAPRGNIAYRVRMLDGNAHASADPESIKKERQERLDHTKEEMRQGVSSGVYVEIPIPGVEGDAGKSFFRPSDNSNWIIDKNGNTLSVAEGGIYTLSSKDGEVRVLWQGTGGDKRGWTEAPPKETIKSKVESKSPADSVGSEPKASSGEYEKDDRAYTAQELADAKTQLSNTLASLGAIADKDDIAAKIANAKVPDDVRALAARMRPLLSPEPKKGPDPLKKRVPSPSERPPLKDAPGIYAGSAGISYEVRDGKLYVRDGKSVRFATAEDEDAYKAAKDAGAKVRTSKPAPGGSLDSGRPTSSAAGPASTEPMPAIGDAYAVKPPSYEHIWVPRRSDMVPKFIRESQAALPTDPRLDQVPDMREILQDRTKNDAFARLVANLEGQEGAWLLHKYENQPDELTDADWNKLDGYRYQLNRRMLMLEEAQENISDEDIEYMLRNAPGMRFITTNLGSDPARMKEIIKSHLASVWMSLPEEPFIRLSEAVKANRDIRRSEAYKRLEETVSQRVSDPRANPENINWRDAAAYQAQAPKDERGWWRRTLDRLQGREGDVQAQRAQAASAATAGNREILQKQEANKHDIMTILAATMAGDAALKRRVVDEARGVPQKLPQLGDTVMSGAQQMEAVNKKMLFLRHAELVSEISSAAFRDKIKARTNLAWNDLTRTQREQFAYEQLVEDGKLPPEPSGGGITGVWLRASYGQSFNYMRKRLHEAGVFNPVT